jgi:glycosyltransferase involved in cell wall biosynthesis
MAKPIVASRLGQIGDVIEDGVSGLLVPPGDVDALVAALARLSADADLRDRLGRGAREAVLRSYTWRRNAERVVESLRSRLTA